MLENRNILITGVANKRSIAWGVASLLIEQNANVFFSCQNDKLKDKLKSLLKESQFDHDRIFTCDFSKDLEIENLFSSLPSLDGMLHAMAYCDLSALEAPLCNIESKQFNSAMEISVHSLLKMVNHAKLNEGASIITLTYIGSQRVMKGYGMMGVCKSALETAVKYLAFELGDKKIRVNAISPGPMKTLASSAFPKFNDVLKKVEDHTPLKRNIDLDDVSELASFLFSPKSKNMTGTTYYVDSGANAIGAS